MQDLQEFLAHLKAPAASTALCGSIIPSIFGGRPSSAKDDQPSTATSKTRELLSDVLLFPEELSTNKAAAFENHISRLFSKPFTGLKDALTATYTNANFLATDALIQQGLGCVSVQVEGVDGVRRGGAFAIQGRLQEADFADKNPKIPHFQKLISSLPGLEEVKISVHYLQTLLAVDLDIEQKLPDGTRLKKTLKMASISEDPVVGSGKKISDHVLEALKSTKFSAAFIDAHLFCTFPTEHGLRFIFAIEPVEVATDGQTNLAPSVAVVSPSSMSKIFTDLNKIFESLTGKGLTLQSGKQLYLSWDTSSTVSPWALSRLGKVFRGVGRDLTGTPVSIFNAATKAKLFETSGAPSTLTLTLAAKAEALGQSPSVKVSTPSDSLTTSPALPASSIFQKVAEADTFKPAQAFRSHDDKVAFAQSLLKNLLGHPLLSVCTRLKNFRYDAWRKILTSFRGLHQYFGELGLSEGQDQVLKEAVSWAEACPGFDSKSENLIRALLQDSHEAMFSAGEIILDLAEDLDAAFAPGESKSVLDSFRPDRSLFGHAYALTNANFQVSKQYSPATGKTKIVAPALPLGKDGMPEKFKTLSVTTAQKVLQMDKILPKVLRFSLTQGQLIVSPNIGDFLTGVLEGVDVEPVADLVFWQPLTDPLLTSIQAYLGEVYFQSVPSAAKLQEHFFPVLCDTSRSVQYCEDFRSNIFFDELSKRHQEWTSAKATGTKVLGTDRFLDEWLPRILHVDPTLSPDHKKYFDLWSSFGKSLLLGMTQRAIVGLSVEVKYEQILLLRGKSQGTGKTSIAKAILSGFFGRQGLSQWAGTSAFLAELSSIPREKDEVSACFGKLLVLMDDIEGFGTMKADNQAYLKAWASKTQDVVRLPYERSHSVRNRTFATVATSNSAYLFSDGSGTRRQMTVDLDAISDQTDTFICRLLDRKTGLPLQKSALNEESPSGFIDISQAGLLLSLAFGEAFERGVLGRSIPADAELQPSYALKTGSTLGRCDVSSQISVESNRLPEHLQKMSEDVNKTFQIGQLTLADHKNLFDLFISSMGVDSGKTEFELFEIKDYFKTNGVSLSDNSFRLWADTVRTIEGVKYKIVAKRCRENGVRVSKWIIWNLTDNCQASTNPFIKKFSGVRPALDAVARQPVLPPKPMAKSFKIQ